MNEEELKEALKIIKEPITVNSVNYKYFDEINYDKLIMVYDNCLWFANNLEQLASNLEQLQQKNQQLKSKLETSEKARKEAIKFMKDCEFDKTDKYIAIGEYQEYKKLLNILDIDKGE